MADTSLRVYIPGKPHPNMIEFIAAVDENMFMFNLHWVKDTSPKYGFPERKLEQMQVFLDYFGSFSTGSSQPFIFYIDAWWGCAKLMEAISKAGMFGVLSCSTSMWPQGLCSALREELDIKDWRTVYWKEQKAVLSVVRCKEKVYLNLLSNHATCKATTVTRKRRKAPMNNYTTLAPECQEDYNHNKYRVDMWNKMHNTYARSRPYGDDKVFFSQWFLHAFLLQAFHFFKACTKNDMSQLQFRIRILDTLHGVLESARIAEPLEQGNFHWPTKNLLTSGKCSYSPCRNTCTYWCAACNRRGCLPCLEKAHLMK